MHLPGIDAAPDPVALAIYESSGITSYSDLADHLGLASACSADICAALLQHRPDLARLVITSDLELRLRRVLRKLGEDGDLEGIRYRLSVLANIQRPGQFNNFVSLLGEDFPLDVSAIVNPMKLDLVAA